MFKANRFREANEIYSELAASGDAKILLNEGVTLAMLGDDEAAAAAYRRALESDPGLHPAKLYLGNALLRLRRRQDAAAVYKGYLDEVKSGEAAERVRRILLQIAPGLLPPAVSPLAPPPPERQEAGPES
jgi:tetratricopeptide (TPR) repeat protein